MAERKDLANAIRALSMDAVQKANSGHPGAPMGMAEIAEVLWNDFMKHNPSNPDWADRDRFVLSNGHGSMLIYSLLHLTGYDLSIDDLKNFRQLHSKTPGHPEYGYAPGVETTTGPLGQGITNAVGMALAEKTLAAQFNRDDHKLVDHYTYVFLGDGCMMEGISHEASSLAGTLGLGKLIAFYDDNGISIVGDVAGVDGDGGWFTDDTPARFESYGWQVIDTTFGTVKEMISIRDPDKRASSDIKMMPVLRHAWLEMPFQNAGPATKALIDELEGVQSVALVICDSLFGLGKHTWDSLEDKFKKPRFTQLLEFCKVRPIFLQRMVINTDIKL